MLFFLSGTTRGRIPIWGRRMAVIVTALAGTLIGHAASTETNYNGHYVLFDPKAKAGRTFTLDVKQNGSRADVSFSAAMADGSGDATDGAGKGRVEDGVLSFILKDSLNNEVTCTLESKTDGYHLAMTVTQVADPRPFHFYGNVVLQKTSNKPRLL